MQSGLKPDQHPGFTSYGHPRDIQDGGIFVIALQCRKEAGRVKIDGASCGWKKISLDDSAKSMIESGLNEGR